jgi:hypothetical protein
VVLLEARGRIWQRSSKKPARSLAKGQTRVPKALRQALGVDCGAKSPIASKRVGSRVHNLEAEHHDPTLAALLGLIEKDFAAGRNVRDRSGPG